MRFNTNVDVKNRKSIELENFLGVDFSSSPINVSNKRASFAKNLINIDGVNQKRPGWKELFDFKSILGSYPSERINGIYKFKINNNGKEEEITLVHHRNSIERIVYDSVNNIYYHMHLSNGLYSRLNDAPSQAFFSNNKLYIIGGAFLVFGVDDSGNYYIHDVKDDKDTYIPTTTIGIKSIETGNTSVESFEEINLLSSKRRNRMIGNSTAESSLSWIVDNGSIKSNTIVNIEVTNNNGLKTLSNKSSNYTKLYDTDDNEVGSIDFANGTITINTSVGLVPVVANEDNIVVTYIPYDADDRISKCTFGCQFGINGLSDTLFLSGNPNHPNLDFYSYTVEENFTYFTEYNIESFGTSSYANKAYLRINDGTLAILKEASNTEPTIYFRSVSSFTEDNITKIVYPISAGAIGEGAINNFANGNLVGDNLFLSNNGVFGLTLANNVVTNERFARERDRFIHSSLIKHDLTNAVATVFHGRYYLAVDNVVYIFDSRYKSTENKDADDTFNYECWYWEDIDISCFCVFKDKLYFGTNDGKYCLLNNNVYSDITTKYLSTGDITHVQYSSTFTASSEFAEYIKENNEFRFCTDRTFPLYRNNYNTYSFFNYNSDPLINYNSITIIQQHDTLDTSEVFLRNDGSIKKLKVGQSIVFAGRMQPSGDSSIILDIIDNENNKILIINDPEGRIRGSYYSQTCIYETFSFKTLYITNTEENEDGGVDFQLKESLNGDAINTYGEGFPLTVPSLRCEIIIHKPIETIWFSPALDLGLYDYSKNIDSISVVLDPNLKGQITFGYETKKVSLDLIAKQIEEARTSISNHSFSFDDIDFNDFTFETAFTSSYTKRVRERNVNFIMFKAYSNDDKNSALQSLKAVYTLYKKNRGVR